MKQEWNILNLGAGVQSTLLYLMAANGELERTCDAAIFADTGEEPAHVYENIAWLQTISGPPLLVRSLGNRLGDDLLRGENSTHQRFVTIPAFTGTSEGGMIRRQCTKEYKIEVVEKAIRRELLGLEERQRIPKDIRICQWFGFSFDEGGRAARTAFRLRGQSPVGVWDGWFPLWERVWSRQRCVEELKRFHPPHEVKRSACVFCPYRSNSEWRDMKASDPESWQRAVEVDSGLRIPGVVVNRGLDEPIFVHRSRVPLEDAPLGEEQGDLFSGECEGGCGI